jgi:hypothetical protein
MEERKHELITNIALAIVFSVAAGFFITSDAVYYAKGETVISTQQLAQLPELDHISILNAQDENVRIKYDIPPTYEDNAYFQALNVEPQVSSTTKQVNLVLGLVFVCGSSFLLTVGILKYK